MKKTVDVIVIGVGSMGAPTCFYLARQGHRVLGLEQFDIPHDQGSHAGQSRIIRKAYFEHADYVPLLERAYQNWNYLEQLTGNQFYFRTGLVYAGKPDSVLNRGVKDSAKQYGIPLDVVQNPVARFPQFRIPEHHEVLFEPEAGLVTPERAILQYVDEATRAGAKIQTKERVVEWTKSGTGLRVKTDRDEYECQSLVITAGPWAGYVMPNLASQLRITRQVIIWVIPKKHADFELGNFPCWLVNDEAHPGMFDGFPTLPAGRLGGPVGLKVAYHYPGSTTHPDQVNRSVSEAEEQFLVHAINRYLPHGYATTHVLKTCLYTNTPDENFIIDYVPEFGKQVVIAAGFSGHGFKFASAVGEVLAGMATSNPINLPIGFLGINRLMGG